MQVFKDLSIFLDCKIDCIYQVSIFDSHDLMIQVHEDDVLGIVLNAQLTFGIVHDIIDSIEGPGLDLFSAEVNLKAPEDETLLLFFGFLKEHIDDVVYRGRNSQ